MHVGIFVEERRRGTSEATAFAEALELTEASEAWGLDGVWLGEIHFNPWRSVQSAPMALAAYMAARTTRVRIGLAVIVLPLAHPLRIHILRVLQDRVASPSELADELQAKLPNVSYHVRFLEKLGLRFERMVEIEWISAERWLVADDAASG